MYYAIQVIQEQSKRLSNRKSKLNLEISQCDKEVSRIYHEIEINKFNASQGYVIAKKLQEALRKRRKVKFEHMQVVNLIKQFQNSEKQLRKIEFDYFGGDDTYKEYVYTSKE